jgi:membrane-bound lytic murein transglycosylase B
MIGYFVKTSISGILKTSVPSVIALTALCVSSAFAKPIALNHPQADTSFNVSAAGFPAFLEILKERAMKEGVSENTANRVMRGIKFYPTVIKLDRKQSEFTITFDKYLQNQAPQSRVKQAAAHYRANKAQFNSIEKKFNIILALWGIETNFGKNTGGFHVPSALATLAYEGRRSEFFAVELINALKIIDGGHIGAAQMTGSWAGAMGQSQFMPSSFLKYATDQSGDGTKDIWRSRADVWASIANYLRTEGWRNGESWGAPVSFPSDMNGLALSEAETEALPLSYWQAKGIQPLSALPANIDTSKMRFVVPKRAGRQAYITFNNFDTIMHWNKSHFFALSAGILSDKIAREIGR